MLDVLYSTHHAGLDNHIDIACAVLQVAELSLKDFYPDQVMMFANTAVLVAAHGAALTNMMFMRPHMGAIVELWYSNYHYANQANMLGHKHFQTGSDPIAVASALSQAMDHVASRY